MSRGEFNRLLRRLRNREIRFPALNSIILVEHIENPPHQIPLGLLSLAQQRVTPGSFRVYSDPARTDLTRRHALQQKIRFFLRGLSKKNTESTYAAFGASVAMFPHFDRKVLEQAEVLEGEAKSKISSKYDLETFRVSGILIGDLLYDEYLHRFNVGTVDVSSPRFREFFRESLKIYVFWDNFFSNNNVVAVIGNSVYRQAIVARIALAHDIPVFDPQVSRVVRLEGDGCEYSDVRLYREEFSKLSGAEQDDGRLQARLALNNKLAGKPDLSTFHIARPTGLKRQSRLTRKTEKPKVLIAPHCFSDSAHSYGKMLFPDFEEWLRFLSNLVNGTDYDWYLKEHPKGANDRPVLEQIFSDSAVTFLPHDASLKQLADEGVSIVLTMRGHVALEMPLMGVRVISCAPGTRYRDYGFTHHARSVPELKELLMDLEKVPAKIDSAEIEEFYFMDSIYNHPNLFFPDLLNSIRLADSRGGGPEILRQFVSETSPTNAREIVGQLRDFSASNRVRFRRTK